MARHVPLVGRIVCRLAVPALVLLAAVASADPIAYALGGAAFADGGKAKGYVVFDARSATVADPPVVTDWAVSVSGGTTPGLDHQLVYDPTNSSSMVTFDFLGQGLWRIVITAPPSFFYPDERRLTFSWSADGPAIGADSAEDCACSSMRLFTSGIFQRLPGPLITVKIDGQHPAGRVHFGGGGAHVTLDVSPAGWTTPVDWFFAIADFDRQVVWLTAGGISQTPVPFAHQAPMPVTNATLLDVSLNGDTFVTFWVYAMDGPNVVAADHMAEDVPPSP